MGRPRILVADDEPAILKSAAILLADLGYEPVIETRPDAIASTLAASGATVLLQDVRMPGLDIDRHVRALRSDPAFERIRIILFSASLDVADIARRLPVDGYVEKPFTPEGLLAVTSPPAAPPT